MNKSFRYSFGNDPESWIRNIKTGKIVNAVDIVPFDKHNPHDLGDGFSFFRDCCSVEGNVPPSFSREEAVHNIYELWDRIRGVIGKKTYDIAFKAAHIFPDEEVATEESSTIGCSSFYISRTLEVADTPVFEGGIRASGFHIALGRDDFKTAPEDAFLIDPMSKVNFINTMDLFVGIPSTIFDNDENARFRNSLYKQRAGSHRPTPFGAEYRPLSAGVMRDKELVGLIYDLTILAAEAAEENKDFGITDEQVYECMNAFNVDLSKQIIEQVIPKEFVKKIYGFANHNQ